MRKLAPTIPVIDIPNEGLPSLLGELVLIETPNYLYHGTLEGINDTFIKLSMDDAAVVYETGTWSDKVWKDAQKLGAAKYIRLSAIISFQAGK